MLYMQSNILEGIEEHIKIIRFLITLIITIIIFTLILKYVKKYLLKLVKTKRQLSNVLVFLNLLKYLFILLLIIIIVLSYYGNWSELSFIVGLLTVALGLALQKPISSVVAWLIIVIRRPFHIGDRISIDDIKGDVSNFSLTHFFLDEVAGTIDGEESSGRIVMIPNSYLFEKEIINYTYQDEYILDEVITTITYESNLEKAEKIIENAVKKIMKPYWAEITKPFSKKSYIRLLFQDSGIDVIARYITIATERGEIETKIIREIFNQIKNINDIEIAYPHTEIIYRKKDEM